MFDLLVPIDILCEPNIYLKTEFTSKFLQNQFIPLLMLYMVVKLVSDCVGWSLITMRIVLGSRGQSQAVPPSARTVATTQVPD